MESEKHLVLTLPEVMVTDGPDVLAAAYDEWKKSIPLAESQSGLRKRGGGRGTEAEDDRLTGSSVTLTGVMQRILAWQLESKSPLETMSFLADVKHQLAALV